MEDNDERAPELPDLFDVFRDCNMKPESSSWCSTDMSESGVLPPHRSGSGFGGGGGKMVAVVVVFVVVGGWAGAVWR